MPFPPLVSSSFRFACRATAPKVGDGCSRKATSLAKVQERTVELMLRLLAADHIPDDAAEGKAPAGPGRTRRTPTALSGWQPLLVHVGAHLGYLAMVAAARGGARALAFEMVRDFAARARLSLELNELQTAVELREERVSAEPRRMHTFRVGSRGLATPPFGAATGTELEGWGGFAGVRLDAAAASVARIDVLVVTVDGCEIDVLESATALFEARKVASVLLDICPSAWEQCGTLDTYTGVAAIARLCDAANCSVYEMNVGSEGDDDAAAAAAPAVAELLVSLSPGSARSAELADEAASGLWELPSGAALHATVRRLAQLRACMSVVAVMREAPGGAGDRRVEVMERRASAGVEEVVGVGRHPTGTFEAEVRADAQVQAQAQLLDESADAVLELS